MRNLILSAIFFGVAVYLGAIVFEKYSSGELHEAPRPSGADANEVPGFSYPDDIELKSDDGRTLFVSLIGRTESKIQFIRESDGATFVYPISGLTLETREEVLRYPVTAIKNASHYMKSGAMSLGEVYIEQLRVRISEIEAEIARLTNAYSASQNLSDKRAMKNEIYDLREEHTKYESRIRERLADVK